MSERAPRETAKNRLLRETESLEIDKLVMPGDADYVSMPDDTRPLAEQEPAVLFRHPEKTSHLYGSRLSGAGENAFLEIMGVSRSRTYAREKSHETFQDGFNKGYEAGRQSAAAEIAKLTKELSKARKETERLSTDVDDLRGQVEMLKQQVVTLAAAVGETEPTPTSEPDTATEATPNPSAAPETPAEAGDPDPAIVVIPPIETGPAEPAESELTVVEADATAEAVPVEAVPADQQSRGWFGRQWGRTNATVGNIMTGRTTEVRETDRRRRFLGTVILVGAGIIVWEIFEHKYLGHSTSREIRNHSHDQLSQLQTQTATDHTTEMNAIAANKAQIVANHNSEVKAINELSKQVHAINVFEHQEALGGHSKHLVDVGHAQANTITAHSPANFQKNVTQLLRNQGLRVSGDTPHRLAQMSSWMRGQQIASGVNADHSQHLVKFSASAFNNPSHQTGFKIGADGSGSRALHGWINHAKSIGIKISA